MVDEVVDGGQGGPGGGVHRRGRLAQLACMGLCHTSGYLFSAYWTPFIVAAGFLGTGIEQILGGQAACCRNKKIRHPEKC